MAATEGVGNVYTINGTGGVVSETANTTSREYERQLVSRARQGERSAARELVDRHKDRLFAFILRMTRHHHDTEEICQDALLKAFASFDSFSTQYRFSTWLFTIAYRVCLNQLRRKRALTGEVDFAAIRDEAANVSGRLESEDAQRLKDRLWLAVDKLSPAQRATLILYYRQELGCPEIARILQVPVATVKSHLHRARNRLRDMLDTVADTDLDAFRNCAGMAG